MIWFRFVWFYGISTFRDYLMTNPIYTYISNTYELVCLSFMTYQLLLVIQYQILLIYILNIYDLVWLGFMAYQLLLVI